jgi:hypothetical protein
MSHKVYIVNSRLDPGRLERIPIVLALDGRQRILVSEILLNLSDYSFDSQSRLL